MILAALGLLQSAAGIVVGLPHLATRNPEGIPLWAPLSLALAFSLVAVACWGRQLAPRLLAAFWALSGGCFAKSSLRSLGWWLPLELPAVLAAVGLALYAGRRSAPPLLRAASSTAALAPVFVAATLEQPPSPADAAVYPLLLILALPSAALGLMLLRKSR